MTSDPLILAIMAFLAISLIALGEKTHIGVYFLVACIPIAYIGLIVQAFMMFAFSGSLISFCVFRSVYPRKD